MLYGDLKMAKTKCDLFWAVWDFWLLWDFDFF
jgi:hypothetical protein